jgi:hypothetical protein
MIGRNHKKNIKCSSLVIFEIGTTKLTLAIRIIFSAALLGSD